VVLGAPIPMRGWKSKERHELAAKLRRAIEEMLQSGIPGTSGGGESS
jgi:hypothetical protein